MKTTVHAYRFDCEKSEDKKQYAELEKMLKARGSKCFCTCVDD